MTRLFIDIETYSATDVKKGPYRYSEDPQFQILMAAWCLDEGPVSVAIGEREIRRIPGLWDSSVEKVAHNAMFERVCLSRLQPSSEPFIPPNHWYDTMAVAIEWGYPASLKDLALALGGEQKDEAGTRLINLFCKPNRQGNRVLPEERPEEWAEFVEYCRQDVVTMVDVARKMDWPTKKERRIWEVDQHINDRGIALDREMAEVAVPAAEDNRMIAEIEVSHLTKVANPGSNQQLMGWLQKSGLNIQNMQAETIEALLEGPLDPVQRQVLELRQDIALVAAKKFTSALGSVSGDGRLRGGFRFFGAHTGRWSGQGVQLHNLPRASLPTEADTEAAILDLKIGLGAGPATLKALVRALFTGPFTVVDYAAIEARVIAWLADEQWALEAFKAGRDIYVETAQRMGGLTRSQGKVAVLALGYNGGVGSLRAMGAEGSDDELQTLVTQWRRANPSIVSLWSQMEDAFRLGGQVGSRIRVETRGDSRFVWLPSGRAIAYHKCKWQIEDGPYGPRRKASFSDPKKSGARAYTYGGRIIENVTQAVARDILAEALVRLHDARYTVVGHVHDEILVEGAPPVQWISSIMDETPAWAKGLPISSEGFQCARYRKG